MWFCAPLLLDTIVFCFIMKNESELLRALLVFVISITSYIWIANGFTSLFNNINYLIIMPIIYCGYLFKKLNVSKSTNKIVSIIIIVVGISILSFLTVNGIVAYLQPRRIVGIPICLIYPIAIIGIMTIYHLSILINQTSLEYFFRILGDYSFSIMAFHFFGFKIISLLMCLVQHRPISDIIAFPYIEYKSPIWFLLYVSIGCIFPVILSKVYHYSIEKVKYLINER